MRRRGVKKTIIALAAAALLGGTAYGQNRFVGKKGEAPFLLNADEVIHDRALGLVIATGHVEVAEGQRVLRADRLTYDIRHNLVTASGHVAIVEPSGEVMFADYVQLSDDMKNGVARNIMILLSDMSRLAAAGARREGGERTVAAKAVYSPCQACAADPNRPLVWQIKALRVIHDQVHHEVEYKDATLEMFGVPVAWSPYFSHPDPTVKRRSGFLAPQYGSSSELGLMLQVPYFYALGQDKDLVVAPKLMTRDNPLLAAQYRQRLTDGQFEFDGSGLHDKFGQNRGYIHGQGLFDINDTWRWGFSGARTSDKTYLARYHINNDQSLTSDLFAEGFRGRSYAAADALAFQGLTAADTAGQTPLVLPYLRLNYVGDPGSNGAFTTLDASALSLTRSQGQDVQRLHLKGGWQLPYIAPLGDIYTLSASLQTDGYLVEHFQNPSNPTQTESNATGRVFPQLALDWRFPLVTTGSLGSQTLTPIVQAVVSPYSGNASLIPNEDSQNFELDQANIFSLNRVAGVDRVDSGPRLNYGGEWGTYAANGAGTLLSLGQSYRLKRNTMFLPGTGADQRLSDLVGEARAWPSQYLSFLYRFRLSRSNFHPLRSELGLSAGPRALRLDLNYAYLDSSTTGFTLPTREEVLGSLTSQMTRYWRGGVQTRRDLGSNGGTIDAGLSLIYEDECLTFTTTAVRNFTQYLGVPGGETIMFRIGFKNLGQVQAGGAL